MMDILFWIYIYWSTCYLLILGDILRKKKPLPTGVVVISGIAAPVLPFLMVYFFYLGVRKAMRDE